MKLSDICRDQLKRFSYDDYTWIDYVEIQEHIDMVLIYFITINEDGHKLKEILWIRNNKVIMFEGRVNNNFYSQKSLGNIVWNIIKKDKKIKLDIQECLKLRNCKREGD